MTQPAVPDSHRDLFVGRAVSLSTLNADQTIQSTAIWVHLGDDGLLRTSLATARQKYRNLADRPTATILAISPSDQFHTAEIRATVTITDDPHRSFLAQLLVPYGHTLETFDTRINQAAEDRVVVTFHPTRVRTA